MAGATTTVEQANQAAPGGKRRLVLLAGPLLLAALLAGLWFTGILPHLLGLGHAEKPDTVAAAPVPVFLDLPDIVANLNTGGHRPSYIKLNARIELSNQQELERARQMLPRIQDLFQTYLREMRPEELRGSAGSYRLREELIARADIALAPARVSNILFTQMLIQ
jgi:flagellar FliL protein